MSPLRLRCAANRACDAGCGGTPQPNLARAPAAAFGVLAELVNPGTAAARWNDYLAVGSVKVGMRVTEVTTQTVSTRYFHTDHLGSIAVITNEAGAVVERLSYDAWGKRRFPNGADDPAGSIESQTTRGFTGHEELDAVGLVHMNGRVYDPLVGRMISADPTVPDPLNAQAWNRYSYVGNDPLAFTDPSGYSWLSKFFRSVGNFFQKVFNKIPILRTIVQIAVTAILAPVMVFAGPVLAPVLAAAAGAAIVTGLSGGKLGDIIKNAAIAAATVFAFNAVGDFTNLFAGANPLPGGGHGIPTFMSEAHLVNMAGHAAVGCGMAVAAGGKCGSGALAGAAGSAAAPLAGTVFPNAKTDPAHFIGATAMSGAVGGLASVAGGGKFENGAITGAFGYMFNSMADCMRSTPRACMMAEGGAGGGGGRGNLDVGQSVSSAFGRAANVVRGWFRSENVTFQSEHASRHLVGTNLTQDAVEGAIRSQITGQITSMPISEVSRGFWGRVPVNGQLIEYRAFGLPNNQINVGTYYVVSGP